MDIKIIEDGRMPKDQILVTMDDLFDAYGRIVQQGRDYQLMIDRKIFALIMKTGEEEGVRLSTFKFTDWKWEV